MQKLQKNFGIEEALTPLDGRNRHKLISLVPYFSELALNKYRILVEIKYLQQLSKYKVIRKLTKKEIATLYRYTVAFDNKDKQRIKEIERITNHDVKAIEYFLREKFRKVKLKDISSFIHIGITSDDINNLAYALILRDFNKNILSSLLEELITKLLKLAHETKQVAILGRTHGQPAVPTTFGKEIANYVYRLKKQQQKLKNFVFEGKLNGAVGNYNALHFVYPKIDWLSFSKELIKDLGLKANIYTTQILFYDNFIEFFQTVLLINAIIIDLSINMWLYISLNIVKPQPKKDEVGSSTMPQKINPIDFERAEGNLQLANAHFDFYSRKLVLSRLQRDLSDSTVRRTFGEAFAYTILAWQNILDGLTKIRVDEKYAKAELNSHWEVLSEALQVYLRAKGDELGYEKLKKLTRGKTISKNDFKKIIKRLGVEKEKPFINLKPENYLGLAQKLAQSI